MNKVIQANLAGLAFTFDADAYEQLDDYLASIDGYFRDAAGHDDIMHDIEARLAELFSANLKGRSIVTIEDVIAATKTLGSPEQLFGLDEELDAQEHQDSQVQSRSFRHRSQGYSRYGRKLMRDGDEKVIGGVCGGLSAYFGIENPVWMRIAFAAAFLGAGIGLLPYIILWIAMPLARTAGDRLAMHGEPIDVQGISSQVEREANQIASRLQDWGTEVTKTDWSAKFKQGRNGQRRRRQSAERDENYMA